MILPNREDGGTLEGSNTPGHISVNDDKLTPQRIMVSSNFSAINPTSKRIPRGVVKRLAGECGLFLDERVRNAESVCQTTLNHSGLGLPTHPASDLHLNSVHIEE